MTTTRRTLLGVAGAALAFPARASAAPLFGVLGKMKAQPGQRAELVAILLEGTNAMPGCKSYIVAEDREDPDAIWITEVWDNEASHAASLQLPQVRTAIARARPLIAGFDTMVKTRVIGGMGL
ncbi:MULTISPECIES: putative quinol monooxygenase [unclassified Sphingomonas]|uniref:putative quinol monooxygenase n=1 Tax=unclassified Sphingomonas TaxID=196159 RepID=UPI000833E2B4|nr:MULTISPECIES: putative quinol monooxygenase [unclassified Sphingomonas]